MRRMLAAVGAAVAALALVLPSSAPTSALRAGYGLIGGYDRGGYEYSALAGNIKFGGYDRGGYEYS